MKISVLIPAHNEEKSIAKCLDSVLNQSRRPDQVVVVNDGSSDRTQEILEKYAKKITIVHLLKCTGNKSYAQEHGLAFIRGDIFICTDADTILDRHFVREVAKEFEKDEALAAACGYVESLEHNWLTACREIDYALGQKVHKHAQSILNFLVVIPGCAAAFRTDIFKRCVTFDHDTVAEDLDFTYKLNRQGQRIVYCPRAKVYTQDPDRLRSYINQMKRWYRGNWQNLIKHIRILGRPVSAYELSLAYIEGLMLPSLIIVIGIISLPFLGKIMLAMVASSVMITTFAALTTGRIKLVLYAFHFLFIMLVNSFIFFSEFIKEVILRKKMLTWFQPERREII